ncbi:MAG: DOPA 4,5-dioxygenase family protein, partial [Polyangiales bacterium]
AAPAPIAIKSFHAHIYFRSPDERSHALQLREWIGERFSVQLGRVHEVPVGPHSQAMYQIAFAREVFEPLVSFLMVQHGALSVLVHPNTGRARDDHLSHAIWLGEPLPVRGDTLSNEPKDDVISPVVPNTTPKSAAVKA